ncbi:3-hydroxyisobutyrate dehydrogenase [Mucor mucedo]|uniref:3-hydroxyisobutyrate dehydrogenase n=1 Tax=Mucor mucedo TaxID=29922 RepID=UPI002220584F|nr:3-hydroxyisobutyrate dehydrogenase [Mucor mucedo]KAI7893745.1 3-hydroxyisobutyrate dehydrogenase [Mucor mucedo]
MAKNLALKATSTVYVYDINEAALQRISTEYPNLQVVRSVSELAEKTSTVITMLPESAHVEKVYEALLPNLDGSSRLIDSSTIDASVSKAVAEKVAEKGGSAFDAPVSGGTLGADAGTLTFMVGAPSTQAFETVKPVLSLMGKNVIYCGQNGSGQVAKLCNNMLLGISMIGVSEAMHLGTQLGMDPHLLASILNNSTGRCWSSDTYNPYPGVNPTAPASRDYTGGFSNKLMAKDLRLAMKAAEKCNTTPELGTMASKVYEKLSTTKNFDTLDFSSVFKWISQK